MTGKTLYESPTIAARPGEEIVTTTCGHNCGGRCVVNAHVEDGRIVRISTDPRRWTPEVPPLPACVRGFGALERVYHPERILHPLRRVGPRGAGRWERVSWDEALDEVAGHLRRVRDSHGPAAILDASRSGNTALLHNRASVQRLLHLLGGCTELWSNLSAEAEVFAIRHTFGPKADYKSAGREGADYANSKLILMWGWSPGDGHFGTGTIEYLKWARRQGTRVVCVDPRITHTSAQVADEHVFVRPSTDTAMLIAMAQVILAEGLHDRAFCDRLVLGLDEAHLPPGAPAGASWHSYLAGRADGVAKTPEWAEALCGVPAATIRRLAIEFATSRPAAIHCGYAPGRTLYGEQFHRAAYALAAITGNIGIPGGNTGCSGGAKRRLAGRFLPGPNPAGARVASPLLADLLARGRAGGHPADIKMIYSAYGDLFNQCGNVNKTLAALDRVEFIAVHDHFLTPTARHADVVLPATTFLERDDMHVPWSGAGHYAFFMRRAIAPVGECRNDLDICADLARRLGLEGYNDKTDEQWLRETCEGTEIDDFEAFRRHGLARLPAPEDLVAFAREVEDPERHPFSTPSGKIEIYSTSLAAKPDVYGLGAVPAVPTYVHPYPDDSRHPLLMVTPKSRARTHSIHDNQPVLSRADSQDVWIHPDDAATRGIADGDRVRVFNERGATVLPARVTGRIARGVVCIKEGAWFTPDGAGQDTRGCANVLTADRAAPSGASTYNTCQVQIAPERR
jgi:anaerobic dimethyl sulfoxide reductase subunit A